MVAPRPVDVPTQSAYEVRFDWAKEGLASIAPGAGVIVVVDAISFTTTVERAVSEGLQIVPFDPSRSSGPSSGAAGSDSGISGPGSPADAAAAANAVLGSGRGEPGISLSPSSITTESAASIAPQTRVLLPSLNGSRLSVATAEFDVPVIAATLRNRSAIAKWILQLQKDRGTRVRVAIVAAGEARADGSIRFSVEDLLTAGAVIDALADVGIDYCSPEAAAACAAYTGLARATAHLMTASVSGQQLIEDDQRADVVLAAERDVSDTVPVLVDGAFTAG